MSKVICIKELICGDDYNFILHSYYLVVIRPNILLGYFMLSIDNIYKINITKEEFEEHFIEIAKFREKQIDEILN